jgi:phage-related tail fiber protein
MFGLTNRDNLPQNTLDEFEHLVSSMKAWGLKEHNEDGTHFTTATTNVPLGSVLPYAGTAAPNANWLLCDGSAISRATYQTLFNLVGTTYGAGDGATTFNVPDLRQRFPLGKAAAGTGSTLGSTGGSIDHSHAISGATGATAPGTDSQGAHTHGGTTGSESAHTHTFSVTSDIATITTLGFDTGLFNVGAGGAYQHNHGCNWNNFCWKLSLTYD